MALNLRSLVGRLNTTCRGAVESAAGLCLSRSHYDVEIEHVLLKLLEVDNSDLRRILRQFDIAPERVEQALAQALDGLKSGNQRTPALSPHIPLLLERGWAWASIEFGEARVRSGHLLVALLADAELRRLLGNVAAALAPINLETLLQNFHALVDASVEARDARALGDTGGTPASADAASAGGRPSATPNLDQYCQNLTQRARDGKLDPVLGRDGEIRLMIDVLMRRRQNNPILTGEAGVGKTAVVEGLAARIAAAEVPPPLRNVELLSLDLGLLQAGASVKGEFENRLKGVIEEVKSSTKPIIVFIDEAHTLIGAGGAAGQNDAANLLKPALARGEMRTIAATTWSEYKKYFEKDPALTRRFQVVKVDEPEDDKAVAMLRGVARAMAAHHRVRILDEAVRDAVKLSSRYIAGRQLPDKAVSVLDTACAKIAIGQSATPAQVEDTRRRMEEIATERAQLERETAGGGDHLARLAELAEEHTALQQRLEALDGRWQGEKDLVAKIHERLDAAEAPDADAAVRAAAVSELDALHAELRGLQGEAPMVLPVVDATAVAQIIAGWTGIPVGRMVADEIQTVLNLREHLEQRVIGQGHALEAIAQRVRTSRANLEDPNKPKGVFLLVGTSGVGKTETAIALAEMLYGGERSMITINMSEYQEAHTVSSLKGSPPGYVGYGEGGVLTEAVRRRPYSVVLLDEIEKAHPDVLELFFQVFDKGRMEDGEGREIDFRNTVIILTSNAGTDLVMQACRGADALPDGGLPSVERLNELLKPELNRVFKPAFLGRTTVIPFYPLDDANMRKIVRLKLGKIARRIQANHGARFDYDDALVDAVAARCTEVDSGARNIDNILTGSLLPEVAAEVLTRMSRGAALSRIHAGIDAHGRFAYSLE
ncbi:type VI secretion system ATPase TssH [Lysobacter gummosus]|uniref:Type VI secretion system ATPase TssH n=1 Tax=Lysobacter gummosus TaxID=262324 RepID=A0ABY3XJN0_9GAMM|nr:type VI secretion system ATPase TssH [Lysobacter gummosus]ALN91475.1 type VI secretion ATPase, ClpV1 family [Lysobacter gummosus]UNP31842.1 type VI secretion system ATPase TssH [Lysobacter gummosus]